MKTHHVLVIFALLLAAQALLQAETMEITPDLRLKGPPVYGLEYDAQMHYANGASFLDMDEYDYTNQSLLNSSRLLLERRADYYNNFRTRVDLGEITVERFYDSLDGNPMYSSTIGDGIGTTGSISADGHIYAGANVHVYGGVFAGYGSIDSLYASTVITTPKWRVPDYVFDPSYNRMSLTDLETFVRANRHLPDIPSASEIEARGMDLTEMNIKLLKTVEELTLHVIDIERELKSMRENTVKPRVLHESSTIQEEKP